MIDWDILAEPWEVNRRISTLSPPFTWIFDGVSLAGGLDWVAYESASERSVFLGPIKLHYLKKFINPAINRAIIRTGVHYDQRILDLPLAGQ